MNLRLFLYPFSLLYEGAVRFRNYMFSIGILKEQSFKIPIIVIGNLSTGGTGKTPHVEYLANLFKDLYRTAILSRGYGRKTSSFLIAKSEVTSTLIGDEPMQYFEKFKNVTVSVCEDRVEGINNLLKQEYPPQLIIMDDGFQHRYVNAGIKIILSSYKHLFTSDYLLPAGNLREPRESYKRADIIIVTKCPDNISDDKKNSIKKEISLMANQHLFFSSFNYGNLISLFNDKIIAVSSLSGFHIILFTGIADPAPLQNFLISHTSQVSSLIFPDHHHFTQKDIKMLKEKIDKFAGLNTIIVITEKDHNRIKHTDEFKLINQLPVFYIPVTVKIDNEEIFNNLLINYVGENQGNS